MLRFASSVRLPYALGAISVVGFGLLWRSRVLPLPPFLVKYGGDALWAAMVYLLIRFARPARTILRSATIAFIIAAFIEFAQLYHSPWIDAVRGTRLGALALGNTFNWPDIPAYAIGIALATLVDVWFRTRLHPPAVPAQERVHP